MPLIHNERVKLLAGALDRASTTCVTVGVVALAAGYLVGLNQLSSALWVLAGGVWMAAAVGLHLTARQVLGALRS